MKRTLLNICLLGLLCASFSTATSDIPKVGLYRVFETQIENTRAYANIAGWNFIWEVDIDREIHELVSSGIEE